ncbi:MAG TPA: hypothetical protein PKV60_06865, partial [Thermomonas sp.]|nr:hypothetical protein [Thermomonas sp.]
MTGHHQSGPATALVAARQNARLAPGVLLVIHFCFHAPPDYATADMGDLLDYTFITDDFNKLPIEQRLELIRDLIKRFSTMEGSESVLMAQWAAMIGGDLR